MSNPANELESLRAALAASGDVAYEWDLVSDRFVCLAGGADAVAETARAVQSGAALNTRVHPEDLPARFDALSKLYEGASSYECEYRVRTTAGEYLWLHDRGVARFAEPGKPTGLRGVLRASWARTRSDGRLEYLANFDELTGHFNRTRLRESLDHALSYCQRYDIPAAYLTIGIDKLTLVNQAFGHEVADAVIVAIGQRLDRCMRASDVIGRVGGDRFGIVLGHCREADIAAIAEKILDAARNTAVLTTAGPIHVTVSIGAVAVPAGAQTATDAMTKADIALQKAKHQGRNCAQVYTASEDEARGRRENMVVVEQVQNALRNGRMTFAYQPVVDAKTGRAAFHECLIRMIQPDGEIVAAGRFMPAVEELGIVRHIDRFAFDLAVRELAEHPEARLAVNVSGLTTSDLAWRRNAVAALRGHPDVARRLVVEITETAGLDDIDECSRFIAALRDLGCRIALDDFGAGYTSFRHLKMLSVDMVKIDGSFVRDIANNPDNRVFVRSLLDLAKNFDLETVAECVETEEDARILADEGVRYLQGYAFGRPVLDRPWAPAVPAPAVARVAQAR
ncbi:MAG: putative bifunctional diguanylate cyclase/phosphodiesterase [Rhodospirillales bacterium]